MNTPVSKNDPKLVELPSNKFVRRPDLTPSIRLGIGFAALMAMKTKNWGTVTGLSKQFMISRTFVYMLATTLETTSHVIYGNKCNSPIKDPVLPYYYMLSLRLEGRCSIEAISSIMKRFDIDKSSIGAISKYLNYIGSLLPSMIETNVGEARFVVYVSDEIFSKSTPILITVDPISSAILRIELADTRKAKDWKNHWECLEDNGYMAIYLVSDEAKGLCAGQKEAMNDLIRQPDTYHAISHRLGRWLNILENAAYKSIQKEFDCFEKINFAKTDRVIDKRITEYEEAKKDASVKIENYDNFNFLYTSIIGELNLFDKNGALRNREKAESNIETALDLFESFDYKKLSATTKKIRGVLPELLNYFDIAESTIERLSSLPVDREAMQALCIAWQWRKNLIKTKIAERRKKYRENEQVCLEIAVGYLQENYDDIKDQVYRELDRIVQSSSLVECINSIIRPYLNNSKNQIGQEMLNLIMFYHNHRRYSAGKRKGKTPYEILTGENQKKDWIDLLFDIIEEKSSFFESSVA